MAKLRSEKAGLPPGALVPVSEDPVQDTTIQVFVYHGEQYTEHCAVSPEKIDVGDPASSVTWIDVNGLADLKAIKAIGERFNLHPLLLEDVLNTDHRPNLEEYQDQLFVVAKMLSLPWRRPRHRGASRSASCWPRATGDQLPGASPAMCSIRSASASATTPAACARWARTTCSTPCWT
jgi:Mg2+ and Co2+ transporter CorA